MGQPPSPLRALAGVLSALCALGIGHAVAALLALPAASPLVAVGSVAVDAAPTLVKETAVRLLGTWDKPVLIGGIAVLLLALAAGIGVLAWQRRRLALIAIALLGLVGAAAASVRTGLYAGEQSVAALPNLVPSLIAGGVGAAALAVVVRLSSPKSAWPARPEQLAALEETERPAADGGSRRRLLAALAGVAVLAAVGAGVGEAIGRARRATRELVTLPRPRSRAAAVPDGAQVADVQPFTTPNPRFYRVDISLVTPRVDVADWTLRIDGEVERPLALRYEDLLALPMIERDITLACVSNEVGGPYVSSARWLGVRFADLIVQVGVRPGVDQVFSYSSDSGYTCSTPYGAVSDGRDAMIAVGMNGEPLPDAHGSPARMVVPGLFGFVSATKWLQRIEFTRYADHVAYWTERGWATDAPVLTQCKIESPASLGTLGARRIIAGTAWAQHRGIAAVEIRIDEGDWQSARLAPTVGADTWRQWWFHYDGAPGRHTAQVRATDSTGVAQPEDRTKVFPDGARGWHQIQFTVDS